MLPLMFILTRSSPTVFNTRITEFNQNLLESSCPYIAYPTSIDLDDSNPYCRDILNLLENRNDFENSERELHNIKISEINNKTYLHLFTKVHHYDSVTYRDIFAVLKEVLNKQTEQYHRIIPIYQASYYIHFLITLITDISISGAYRPAFNNRVDASHGGTTPHRSHGLGLSFNDVLVFTRPLEGHQFLEHATGAETCYVPGAKSARRLDVAESTHRSIRDVALLSFVRPILSKAAL
ncbi:hypothetical protein K1T71_010055 [Dendrolimus kikuchii]|uniref:Uncharacterized protein n=1 Tax=Dendrolimus kikuchii TaxID=765133 RepID=A0ACC1CQK5_9NEOP|nr:hypothetical protein K1T71_010055 [Dendrolimus kikuchii]